MPFHTRLRMLQWLTIAGLVDIGLGLLLLVVASRFMPAAVILWLLSTGFALAMAGSIVLSRLRCPRCGDTFCGPRHDENRRASIFTSRCLACGMQASADSTGAGRGLPAMARPAASPSATRAAAPAAGPLPREVLSALERGDPVEAIKLLRQTTRVGLKEAKDAIDGHRAGLPAPPPAMPAPPRPLPASAAAALVRGDKITAIRLVREQLGLDLKASKDLVDTFDVSRGLGTDGLSPGEVGKSGDGLWLAVVAAAVAALGYYLFFHSA